MNDKDQIMRTPRSTGRSRRQLVAVLAAGGLLVAACGGDDNDAAESTSAPVTAPADDTMAPDTMAPDTMAPDTMAPGDGDMMGAFGPGCADVPAEGDGSFGGMADDPAATAASANPLLSTLVTAVSEAGLVDTLNGEGPFTIFAPTNDAFAKIPAETLDMILADTDLLTTILTYHVIPGASDKAADLGAAGTLDSVQGEAVEFGADGTMVNDANVICSDVPVANGTVHIIDSVLLPPSVVEMMSESEGPMESSMEPSGPGCEAVPADGAGSFDGMAQDPAATAASNNEALSTLVSAVSAAGLVDTLNGEGPFTIFAPTNDAFAAIPAADMDAVMADTDLLTSILTYHVVAGEKMSSADLIAAGEVTTVEGGTVMITEGDSGELMVNGATGVCIDVPTANATVHIIDTVLMPAS